MNHILHGRYTMSSSLVDMDVVVVIIDSFVTSTLARDSVPFVLSRDMSHGFVLSQIASSFEYADNSCLTYIVGQK